MTRRPSRRPRPRRVVATYPPPHRTLDLPLGDFGARAEEALGDICLFMPSGQLAAIVRECQTPAGLETASKRNFPLISQAVHAALNAVVRRRTMAALEKEDAT